MRKNKKGFTLVELLVVIAILAILATVAVVGYTSFIKSANESNDKTLVGQMNTFLQANEVLDYKTIVDLYEGLEENGITADDYQTRVEGRFFFWDKKLNRVLYTDEEYNVIYPSEYKDIKHDTEGHQWYSLTADIKGDGSYDKTTDENGYIVITVHSGAQLYQAIQDLTETEYDIQLKGGETPITSKFTHSINANTIIKLDADIDMMGASLSIGAVSKNVDLTIDGNGHTISGFSNLDNGISNAKLNAEGKERNYYSGLIKYVDENAKVTIKNIKFDNVVGGNKNVGSSALLVGNTKGASVVFENVTISNSTLYGKNKLGALVGGVYQGSTNIEVKQISLTNVDIISTEGESGILFGSTNNGYSEGFNNVKIDKNLFGADGSINFISNCSVVCTSSQVKTAEANTGLNSTLDGKIVKKNDEDAYRPTTAYLGFDDVDTAYADNTSKFNPINNYEQAKSAKWIFDFATNTIVE